MNESPRCAVAVKPRVSGFEITAEGEELLPAKRSYTHTGVHPSLLP